MNTLKQTIFATGIRFRTPFAMLFVSAAFALTIQAEPQLKMCPAPAEAGMVLFQHANSALALQAFSPDEEFVWVDGLSSAGAWHAVAADGPKALLLNEASGSLAFCTLDDKGRPADFLRLNCERRGFTPVAVEGSRILLQNGENGALQEFTFDERGEVTDMRTIWQDSLGWLVRGVDCNRIMLEHAETGDVAIWAANPKVPLFNPYRTFTLPAGWSVRDFSGDFVLLQEELSGALSLVELGEGYSPDKCIELAANGNGWQAVALTL